MKKDQKILLSCGVVLATLLSLCDLYAVSHPCPVNADIWVMGGQSNMSGCGRFQEQLPIDANILMFNMDNTWQPAQEPLHRIYDSNHPAIKNFFIKVHQGSESSFLNNREKLKQNPHNAFVLGVGTGVFFAKHLRKYINRPIALIPCAYGGTFMKDWNPAIRHDVNNSLYNYMLSRINMTGGNIKGVLWSQGEGDACDEAKASNYEQAMLNFIDTLRRDVNKPQLPFIIVQTGRFCTAGSSQPSSSWEKVRNAQLHITRKRKFVFVVGSADLPLDDPIHISYEGHKQLGRRLAEVALTNIYNKKNHANQIDLSSIEFLDPNTISAPPCFPKPARFKIKFNGVSGKLTSQGRPTGFQIRCNSQDNIPMFFRTDFDESDPSAIILSVAFSKGFAPQNGLYLVYAGGMDPYVNITDIADMPLPAFGPVEMPAKIGAINKY